MSLSFESKRLLKKIFETISECEIVVERHRQELCEIPNFAPYSAFCRIDRYADEAIDPSGIQAFMKDNGAGTSATLSIGDCAKVLRFFDSDEDGMMSYNDFLQMVLPCDNNLLRAQAQKRPYTRVGRFDNLPYDIEIGLFNIIKHEVDFIKRVEALIEELEYQPDYTPQAAYQTLDKFGVGKIGEVDLQDFLRQFGGRLIDREVFAIIRRIDTDGDAKIGFGEFADFFCSQVNKETPLHPPQRGKQPEKKKNPKQAPKKDNSRSFEFETYSKGCANTQQLVEDMYGQKGIFKKRIKEVLQNQANLQNEYGSSQQEVFLKPKQKTPIRSGHYSSPLKAASAKKAAMTSAGRPRGGGGDYSETIRNTSPLRGNSRVGASTMASSNFVQSRGPDPNMRQPRFGSPVAEETENGLMKMLVEQLNLDRQVEIKKNDAAAKNDFNMYDAFRIFDIDGVGSVSANDLKHGLADIGVFASQEDINLFVTRNDKDQDRRLSFREFADAVLPSDSYYASILERRQSTHQRINPYRKDDVFSHPTACAFKELIRVSINCESQAEGLRQALSRNPYFNAEEAFRTCDLNRDGIIRSEEIRYLMESRGYFISNQEARAVTKKFDQNGDGVITYGEFMNEVRPKSPSRRF